WATVLNGVGRFVAIALLVATFHVYAAGAMAGVPAGMLVAFAVAAWQRYTFLAGETGSFAWRGWLNRGNSLTTGLGASQFMLSADTIVVRALFDEEGTGLYSAAGMIGRALVLFTIPITAVMFPKIAHSAARSEKTDVLAYALGLTALMGGA